MKQRNLSHWLLLLTLVVFWGTSFASTKIAVDSISPVWVMALRLAIGALLLYVLMRWQGHRLPTDRRALMWYAWLGMIGSVIPFYLISWGTQHIPTGLVGITMGLVPLITLTLAHFLLPDDRLTLQRLLGFIAGFIGLLVLMTPQLPDSNPFLGATQGNIAFFAQIAIILATCGYALQLVTARKSPQMQVIQKSTGVTIAAALCGLLLALVLDPQGIANPSWSSLTAAVSLGVFPTAIAALILFWLVDHAGPAFVTLSNYLIPPFAYGLGIVLMGEPLQLSAIFGLAIILTGIYLAER